MSSSTPRTAALPTTRLAQALCEPDVIGNQPKRGSRAHWTTRRPTVVLQATNTNAVSRGASCLDETSVLQFVDGGLPRAAGVDVRAHMASCRACTELAIWVAADIANGDDNIGR